jgi:hypothetical protein
MSHKAIMPRSNLPYLSFSRALFEPVKGKDDILIFVRIAVVIIIVRDDEPTLRYATRDDTKTGITVLVCHVEWWILFQMHPGGGDQCHRTISQWFAERCPRRGTVIIQLLFLQPFLRQAGKTTEQQGEETILQAVQIHCDSRKLSIPTQI